MKRMSDETIRRINAGVFFNSAAPREKQEIRPWQYVQMAYDQVGVKAPREMPRFRDVEEAEIWMCLDSRYNTRLRECSVLPRVG